MARSLSLESYDEFAQSFLANRANTVARNAVSSAGVKKAARNPQRFGEVKNEFSLSLKQGDVTNQKKSGRCWMFASLNTFRSHIIKTLNLKNFELSQAYPLFFDKLEKANYFLESILSTLDEPLDGRLLHHLLLDPVNDGGQWDMFVNLVEKYGVVPKDVMPETECSSNTSDMDEYLTKLLRKDASLLRKAHREGASAEELGAQKSAMLEEIYRVLAICLGVPPTSFDFEVRDKDDKFIRDANLTPQEFFKKYVGEDLQSMISLINAPTQDKPFNKSYTVSYLGNVIEGRPVKYVNLTIDELKDAAIAQLKDERPVWFGCDVGQNLLRDEGLLDIESIQTNELFDVDFTMSKADKLDYGESLMTHAMTIQGVNLDENGKPTAWRIENSWGEDAGVKGYLIMSDEWFDEYVYQVVVDKKYLPAQTVQIYDTEPLVLKPWDPMGSLA